MQPTQQQRRAFQRLPAKFHPDIPNSTVFYQAHPQKEVNQFSSQLKELFTSPGVVKLDIVAVHGLNGDLVNTWTSNGKLWLRDFLPYAVREQKIPMCRVMSFGYDANTWLNTEWRHLREQADDLLALLDYKRPGDLRNRPLVFVCHSQGGLLFKQAFVQACWWRQRQQPDDLLALRGVMFLGTPHHGSESSALIAAGYTSRLQSPYRITCLTYEPVRSADDEVDIESEPQANFARRPEQVELQQARLARLSGWNKASLETDTGQFPQAPALPKTTLTSLNTLFVNTWAQDQRFWIVNIHETTKYMGILVVSESAADLRIAAHSPRKSSGCLAETVPMPNANHVQLTKFSSRDDANYELVLGWLARMAAGL